MVIHPRIAESLAFVLPAVVYAKGKDFTMKEDVVLISPMRSMNFDDIAAFSK
jgi:hypothetical protein